MEIGKAFGYITQDPQWFKKLFIGGIITAIPLVEAVSDGYQIQTIKNLRQGHPRPLPDWNDAGGFFREGIWLRLMIYAIYIPAFLTTVLAVILTFAGILGWFVDDSTTSFELIIGRLFGWRLIIPLIDGVVLVVLPVVFLIVPALARRLADGESPFSLLNPFPTLGLIFSNFGDYALTRVAVLVLGGIFSIVAVVFNVLPVIGTLAGWVLFSMGRFWGRLLWAYSLAQMNRPNRRVPGSAYLSPSPVGNWQ